MHWIFFWVVDFCWSVANSMRSSQNSGESSNTPCGQSGTQQPCQNSRESSDTLRSQSEAEQRLERSIREFLDKWGLSGTRQPSQSFTESWDTLRSQFEAEQLGSIRDPLDIPWGQSRTQQPSQRSRESSEVPWIQSEAQQTNKLWVCQTCEERWPIEQMPSLGHAGHGREICRQCLTGWIKAQLDLKGWRNINCPSERCNTRLDHVEVKMFAIPEDFVRYDKLATSSALRRIPDWIWCRGRGCEMGQEHVDGDMFTCYYCGYRMCVHHGVEWHKGETCTQYDARLNQKRLKDEKQSEAAIREGCKRCPNCKTAIEKKGGCDHMTCEYLHTLFCIP